MHRTIFCLLSFLAAVSLPAQNFSDPMLAGSWQYTGYTMQGKFYPVASPETLSLYADHVYQSKSVYRQQDSTITRIEAGTWAIDADKIIYSRIHTIPDAGNVHFGNRDYVIASVSDSILVLAGYEGKIPLYINYRRVPDIPRAADAYDYSAPLAEEVNEPETYMRFRYYLVNAADTSKRIELKGYGDFSFYVDDPVTDSSVSHITHYYEGTIDTIADSTLVLALSSEYRVVYYKTGEAVSYHTNYTDYDGPSRVEKRIVLNQITRIGYMSPARNTWNGLGATLLILAVDIITVTPFVSLDYHGGFKAHRFFLWNGIALSCAAAGAPMILLAQDKKFKMAQGKFTDKKHWTLEQGKIAEPQEKFRRVYR